MENNMAAKTTPYTQIIQDPDNPGKKIRRQRTDALGRLGWRLRVRDPRAGDQPERVFYGRFDDAVRELVRRAGDKHPVRDSASQVEDHDRPRLRSEVAGALPVQDPADPQVRRNYPPVLYMGEQEALCMAYIVPGLGPRRRLSSITAGDLTEMIAEVTLKDGKTPSSHTRQSIANTVKAMFRDAQVMGFLSTNIAELVPSSWDAVSTRRRSLTMSIGRMETLAAALDKVWPLPPWARDLTGPEGEGHGDIPRLTAFTGMRWEEFVAVEDESVLLDVGLILVHDTATESGGRREIRRVRDGDEPGKSRAATRSLVVVEQAVPVIKRLQAIRRRGLELEPAREQRRQARGVKRPPNMPLEERWTLLIPGETGGYMSYGHFRKKLQKAHEACGVDYTVHELRHIAASILISSRVSDYQIQQQMGHASVEVTRKVYGHLFKVDCTELARRLSERIDILTEAELAEAEREGNGECDETPDA
ncbi:tyrosine-type recombinase/integrase [Actinoplanes xinjiangensis]|uniref:tyrosine-type recombinase/integrase n=1 Tax=Actinoplanes xinjiangensis TaxID=512350 RepID=UPI00344944C7